VVKKKEPFRASSATAGPLWILSLRGLPPAGLIFMIERREI